MKMINKIALLLLLVSIIGCAKKTHTCKGVVTYFYNEHQGMKPDVGAEIHFIDMSEWSLTKKTELSLDETEINLRIYLAHETRILGPNLAYERHAITPEAYTDSLLDANKDFEKKINQLEARVLSYANSDKTGYYKTYADGNGNFNLTLPEGDYLALVKFANRRGLKISTDIKINGDTDLLFECEKGRYGY